MTVFVLFCFSARDVLLEFGQDIKILLLYYPENIREWTGLEIAEPQRAVENTGEWRLVS